MSAFVMTPRRLAQRSLAGRRSYEATVRRFILEDPTDPDRAAQALSGFMRLHCKMSSPKPRAVTRRYILAATDRLGLPMAREPEAAPEQETEL